MCFFNSVEFESRFSFNENLPDPEPWRPGPKTYPSQSVKAKQQGQGMCESLGILEKMNLMCIAKIVVCCG